MADYYGIMQVASNASASDIKNAYRRLALEWHPDKHPQNQEEATQKFKEISQAYQVLSDVNRRRDYDQSLRNGGQNGAGNSHSSFEFNFDFRSPEDLFENFFGPGFSANFGLDGLNLSFASDMRDVQNSFNSDNFFQMPGFSVPGMSMPAGAVNGHNGNVTQIGLGGNGGSNAFCTGNVRVHTTSYSMTSTSTTVNGRNVTRVQTSRGPEQTVQIFEDGVLKSETKTTSNSNKKLRNK